MYEVKALIGPYRKTWPSYTEACRDADEQCLKEGQPFQVLELRLLYMATSSKLKARERFKNENYS